MGDDYWQTTAQMFSSMFEKPKMTEKLLLKPPFKYLFDIVIQTIKSTGYGKNLYTEEELAADFYDTKEKKMYFLKKIITLVGLMLKEEIEAKPNKIVAGVEPDKTNLFLQALYRAAISGEDSGPYVKKILAKFAKEEGEAGQPRGEEETKQEAPPEKKKAPAKEEPKPAEKSRAAPKEDDKPKGRTKAEPKAEEKAPAKEPEKTQAQPPAKIERPSTASRRVPKDKSNVQVVDDHHKQSSGPSGIIREDSKKKDEDENIFETKPQDNVKLDVDASKHGQFVKDALKDIPTDEATKEETTGGKGIRMGKLGAGRKKPAAAEPGQADFGDKGPSMSASSAAGTSQNEVEGIKKLIQSLTQNINPLKKSIDFINDDIESMNKEMEVWRGQYLNSKAKHQLELANTEEQLQPLQNKYAELEEQIKDRKFKIQAAKSAILQNEQKIQKLLFSVVSNK